MSLQRLPQRGEAVHSVVTCAGKELRRGRRYVDLEVAATDDAGAPLFRGRLSLIWAA